MRTLFSAMTALRVALGSLRRNPLRSVLTAAGILIGVAAVTIVVALGEGANRAVSARIDALGENALMIMPELASSSARGEGRPPLLTDEDARALARELSGADKVAPMSTAAAQVLVGGENVSTQVIGTSRDFFSIRAYRLRAGELWRPTSQSIADKVCVIGDRVRAELFGTEDPVGRVMRIGRHPFTIVGVLEPKGQSPFGGDMDDVVVMPLETLRAKIAPGRPGAVSTILVRAKTSAASDAIQREATMLLRQRHGLAEGVENDFRIRSQEEVRRTQEQVLGVLRVLLLGIALVSLVIGGIGVMNIMLVSVTERTREIGIRMSLGARESDILLQFVIEATLLCVAGGIAGAGVAALGIRALATATSWNMALSPGALVAALGTSSAVGVVFGFLPARRAARLDPVHALTRH